MKKIATLLVLAAMSIGCSQSEPTAELSTTENSTVTNAEQTDLAGSTDPQIDPQIEALANNITELAELANQAEAKYDFNAAAKIWGQLQQLMSQQLGVEAWQTKNAAIAYESAFAKSKFSQQQLQAYRQVENLRLVTQQNLKTGDKRAAHTAVRQLSQLQKQLFGAKSFEFGQSLIQVATLDSGLGQFDTAVGNFNDSLAILAELGLENHPERVLAHSGLANAYLNQAKLKTAAANQKEAARIAGNVWGKQSLELATQANQLGAIYHRAGNLPVAEELFRRSLGIRESRLGNQHLAVAHSNLNLGIVLLDGRSFDEAETSLLRASQIFNAQTGADSAVAQRCQSRLATVYMLQNRPDKAETALKAILAILARSHAPDSDQILTFQFRLSIALGRQGKYAEAGPMMQTVLNFQQQKYGDADSRTLATMQAYAMLLDRTEDTKSATAIRDRIRQVAHLMDDNDFQRR